MKHSVIRMVLAGTLLAGAAGSGLAQPGQQGPARGGDYEKVAEDGAWCWFSDPRAVYYQGKQERIYFSYITSKGDVAISARNMKTGETETFLLHEKLQVDDHNVASILVLADGRLLAFYTEHNGRIFMRRSKEPEDIRTWEEEKVLPFGNRTTYSHPVMLPEENGRIYLFWRGSDWQPSFSYSEDAGTTWADPRAFIAGEGLKNAHRPYLKVASDNKGRIDFLFTDGHPAKETFNSVYHFYYRKGKLYQTGGELIGTMEQLPVSHEKVNKVYDAAATGVRAWIADIALDKRNRPVIVYVRFPRETDHYYHYAYWDGEKWTDRELCRAGGWMPLTPGGLKTREPHYSGGIALDHGNVKKVYLSRQVNGIFEIERWSRRGAGWRNRALTRGSTTSNVRPYV
ncbi:MAG TPA: BNR-4 repeat-containing protein, partial [Anseongella sp.]|nr:BNR-4 repeat-containing protein [Anseongella sp.]